MATPEERKATLHANRLARPASSPPVTSDKPRSSKPHDRQSALQSSRFKALTLATALTLAQSSATSATQQDDAPQSEDSSQNEEEQQMQIEQAQRLAGIQAAIIAQTAQQLAQSQRNEQSEQETQKQREEVKKVAKATFRRGAIYVTDLLAAAFDLGSSGISFIVDIFIYLFTLGWLNLEMIYGKHFTKGKSRYVGPISWDPIPMPIDKEAVILQGFIVAADLALGLALLIFAFGGFCLIHDFVKITGSVTEAAQIGAAIAQGQSGGLCLGGIIASAFGL